MFFWVIFYFFFHLRIIIIIIIIIIILLFWEFFAPAFAEGFSLESEWQQVTRTLLSILADLNNTVVWMVSTRPLISLYRSFGVCTECANYSWYHRHFHAFFDLL